MSADVPVPAIPWIKSWPLLHPSWQLVIHIWNDLTVRYPHLDKLQFSNDRAKSVAACVILLHENGGFCVDTLTEARRPFDVLLESHDTLVGAKASGFGVSTHVMGAAPSNPVFAKVQQMLQTTSQSIGEDDISQMLYAGFSKWDGLLPDWVLETLSEDAFATSHSQGDFDGKERINLSDVIGKLPSGWRDAKDIR